MTDITSTTSLTACDDTGFYARGDDIFWVRFNKTCSARYALELTPPNPTPTRPEVTIGKLYRGREPLHALTRGDRITAATLLRTFATEGPYDLCLFCRHALDEPLPRHFGVGEHCAAKHLGVTRRLLEVLYRHTPPTGPGTPLPAPAPDRHLRLVAVDGRVVAA
jgi:hypothetical protein